MRYLMIVALALVAGCQQRRHAETPPIPADVGTSSSGAELTPKVSTASVTPSFNSAVSPEDQINDTRRMDLTKPITNTVSNDQRWSLVGANEGARDIIELLEKSPAVKSIVVEMDLLLGAEQTPETQARLDVLRAQLATMQAEAMQLIAKAGNSKLAETITIAVRTMSGGYTTGGEDPTAAQEAASQLAPMGKSIMDGPGTAASKAAVEKPSGPTPVVPPNEPGDGR